eukprot:scaffold43934_cov62-Phaeocystis_antarctica.AAC.3
MHCMPITVTALATVTSCTQRVGRGMKHPTEESGGVSAVGHGQDVAIRKRQARLWNRAAEALDVGGLRGRPRRAARK